MAYLWLVLAQTSVGVNIVGSKILLSTLPVTLLLLLRFWIAAIALFVCSLFERRPSYVTEFKRRDAVHLVLQALCAGALFNALMLTGLRYTPANIAGIITAALPAMIAIFSWLLLRERIGLKGAACIGLAVLGLILVNGAHAGVAAPLQLRGPAIIVLALLPEALYYVLCKLHRVNLPIFRLAAWINAINGIVVLPAILVHPSMWPQHVSNQQWLLIAMVGASTALFYVFWYRGCLQVKGSIAGMMTAVMPIATLLLSWLLLSERLNAWQALGMVLVLSSIVVHARAQRT